jgi:hypothetical protein
MKLIQDVIKKSVYCKPAEIPEILVDQFRAKDNDMMMDSSLQIPYFKVNEECLLALNKVIRKA